MTPHNYEIVDCSAFCEVIFFYILPKNLLGDFFDRFNDRVHRIGGKGRPPPGDPGVRPMTRG